MNATIYENFDDVSDPKYEEPFEIPLIKATAESLKGYCTLVECYDDERLIVVPWPVAGPRSLCPGTGTVGTETDDTGCHWQGKDCFFINKAYPDRKIKIGCLEPNQSPGEKRRVLVRAVNYHPDAGQVFFPKEKKPFIAILALPGDNLKLSDLRAFYFDGTIGCQVLPFVWHQAMFPLGEDVLMVGKKSNLHACVYADFPSEFQRYVAIPLRQPE